MDLGAVQFGQSVFSNLVVAVDATRINGGGNGVVLYDMNHTRSALSITRTSISVLHNALALRNRVIVDLSVVFASVSVEQSNRRLRTECYGIEISGMGLVLNIYISLSNSSMLSVGGIQFTGLSNLTGVTLTFIGITIVSNVYAPLEFYDVGMISNLIARFISCNVTLLESMSGIVHLTTFNSSNVTLAMESCAFDCGDVVALFKVKTLLEFKIIVDNSTVFLRSAFKGAVLTMVAVTIQPLSNVSNFMRNCTIANSIPALLSSLVYVVDVTAPSTVASSVRLDVRDSTLVLRGEVATALYIQSCPRVRPDMHLTRCSVALKSTAEGPHSKISGFLAGAFVFLLINSFVDRPLLIIEHSHVACSSLCQIYRVHWENPNGYLFMIYNYSFATSRVTRMQLLISSSSIHQAYSSSLLLRPAFVVANTSDSTFTIQSPTTVIDGFPILFAANDYYGYSVQLLSENNVLDLAGCETTLFDGAPINLSVVQFNDELVTVRGKRSDGGSCGFSLSQEITETLATRSVTASMAALTESKTADVPADKGAVQRMVTAVSGVAFGVAAVASAVNPMAGMSAQRGVTVALLSLCPGNGIIPEVFSPTGWCIGRDRNSCVRGAVAGNMLILGGFALVGSAASVGLACASDDSVLEKAAKLRIPGLLIGPFSFLFLPTLSSAVSLVLTPTRGSDSIIGLATVLALGGCVCWMVLVVTRYKSLFT